MSDENRNENNTTQYNLNNYKKYIFILLFLIGLSSFILFININKYKYGYFIEGTNLKYNHYNGYNNVFRLDDNNIFILGENGIPSELYNINKNKSKKISNLILNRCTYENSLNIEMFDKNKLLITGGRCGMNLIFIPTLNSKNPMKQSEILNLETNDNILGPISKYFIHGSSMVALKNGDIFISNSTGNNLSKKVQIFRKGKRK